MREGRLKKTGLCRGCPSDWEFKKPSRRPLIGEKTQERGKRELKYIVFPEEINLHAKERK